MACAINVFVITFIAHNQHIFVFSDRLISCMMSSAAKKVLKNFVLKSFVWEPKQPKLNIFYFENFLHKQAYIYEAYFRWTKNYQNEMRPLNTCIIILPY